MAADGYEAVLTNLFEEDLDTELAWRAHEVGPGSAASFLDSFEQAKRCGGFLSRLHAVSRGLGLSLGAG